MLADPANVCLLPTAGLLVLLSGPADAMMCTAAASQSRGEYQRKRKSRYMFGTANQPTSALKRKANCRGIAIFWGEDVRHPFRIQYGPQ